MVHCNIDRQARQVVKVNIGDRPVPDRDTHYDRSNIPQTDNRTSIGRVKRRPFSYEMQEEKARV